MRSSPLSRRRRRGWIGWMAILMLAAGAGVQAADQSPQPAGIVRSGQILRFGDQPYLYRWSSNHQHEFTPPGQEDLSRWTDMLTINLYPSVRDGEGLADAANRVLATYRSNSGQVVRTASVPRAAERPAEHLIVVLFPGREAIEVAFARFRMTEGIGSAVIYSHRVHGRQAGPAMATWLEANGPAIERRLMALDGLPSPGQLEPGLAR
ncbi:MULTISPECIES: hypothetical protein [Aphanothece]|uniref:hypothetical protein n=1 Tax=Aphanothece TaxID=1121 RepID=UPI00398E59DF